MTVTTDQDISVETRGDFGRDAAQAATRSVASACRHLDEPVLFAEVKLDHEPDPARQRPYIAEAAVTIPGGTIRAHVAASHPREAIDLLNDRLVRRIERHHSRRTGRHHHGVAVARPEEHEWRHGDLPTQRPERFDRRAEERELVRHKTFATAEITPDEAADMLDCLGHDFLLFTNLITRADAVVSFGEDGLELIDASGRPDALGDDTVTPMRLSKVAVRRCDTDEAIRELDIDVEPFVFFLDPTQARGQVLYRRYDGHYGLITAADAPTSSV